MSDDGTTDLNSPSNGVGGGGIIETGRIEKGDGSSSSSVRNRHDDTELLQRLESRHYYSTTTALAITVGVGCVLLILNMLIFAGIYYQRDREKKRAASDCAPGSNRPGSGQENLPMTTRPASSQNQNNSCNNQSEEPPPSYTTLARPNPSVTVDEQQRQILMSEDNLQRIPRIVSNKDQKNLTHKDPVPPKPPARTTSSLTNNTNSVKKRVQIQEISV